MDRTPTLLSRAATATVGVLATALVVVAVAPDGVPPYGRVVLLVNCVVSSVAALVLMRDDSSGARLAAMSTAVLSVAGALLVGFVGLPGGTPATFGGTEGTVMALGLAAAGLLGLDARARSDHEGARPPYAL